MPKLQNGQIFPDLSLEVLDSGRREMVELTQGRWSLIMFYRADWCPRCHAYWDQVAEMKAEIEATGLNLIAASTDAEPEARATRDRHGLWFPIGYGLSLDVGRGLDIYVNEHRSCLEPAFFLLDEERKIRQAVISSGAGARPHIADFLARVEFLRRQPA